MGRERIWMLWLFIQLPSTMVHGCSCPVGGPPTVCGDYEASVNVYTARVINATCNCIPDVDYHDLNSFIAFYSNTTNVSCVSATKDSRGLISETVTRTTCDVYDSYHILPCKNILTNFADCPYEGQVFMDCAPLCPTTCSNMGVASPCPSVCVGGCGCPEGMVIDEEQRRCVMSSQCPSQACPLVGQVTTLCTSSCPQDCFRPGNESCVQLCDGCACAPPAIADYITGRCVQPEQCTACPIEGQVYTECGSSCPRTCDNVNDTIPCTLECWQGCECPSGMVIDVEQRRCVESSQCTTRSEPPPVVQRTSEDGRYGCTPRFVCPHNEVADEVNNYSPCLYTVEVTRVFKGTLEVGDVVVGSGPDLLTTCGNPANILSVNATYIIGVGRFCSRYNNWTEYSLFASADLALIANNCSAEPSAAIAPLPNVVTLVLLAAVSYFGKLF